MFLEQWNANECMCRQILVSLVKYLLKYLLRSQSQTPCWSSFLTVQPNTTKHHGAILALQHKPSLINCQRVSFPDSTSISISSTNKDIVGSFG